MATRGSRAQNEIERQLGVRQKGGSPPWIAGMIDSPNGRNASARIATLVSACAIAAGLGGCATVQETPYPVQPVKVIVRAPVGNAGDLMGRATGPMDPG